MRGSNVLRLNIFRLRPAIFAGSSLMVMWAWTTMCFAAANPAAEYCEAMGYTYKIEQGSNGAAGYCILPDASRISAWEFLRGKAGQNYSYCAQKGYGIETETVESDGFKMEKALCVPQTYGKQSTEPLPMLELMKQDGLLKDPAEYNRTLPDIIPSSETLKTAITKTFSASFDWRSYNGHSYIGSVRDQGDCGACYSFGAAAAAEGAYNYANAKVDSEVVNFSESYIMWCLGKYGPYSDHFSGCDGADYEYKEIEALTVLGVTWEANFPYTGTNDPGQCSHWNDPTVTFATWGRVASNNEEQIKYALSTYGVLDAAVYVDTSFYYYSGGIYQNSNTSCPNGAYSIANHAVSLVGWGTDATYGTYWILRNSWGSGWGENGYMRIQAQSAGVGCATTFIKANGVNSGENGQSLPAVFHLLL